MISNFLFHRVNPQRDKLWDPMDVALFDRCIKYITSKYETVLFEELMLRDKVLSNSRKMATIMFDDGYKDNISYAAPILSKYNCVASFYVVTDCIDNNFPPWTYVLDNLFLSTLNNELHLDFEFLPEELNQYNLSTAEKRFQYVKKVKPFLKQLPHQQRDQFMQKVMTTYNDVDIRGLMMNWTDLSQLKNAGHYIGSHTVSHNMLGTINDTDLVKLELCQSGRRIEAELGHSPDTISYPVGSYDANTIQLAKDCGYKYGLAVKQRIYNPTSHNKYEIPRIELYNESWFKTKLRISNNLERIKALIR